MNVQETNEIRELTMDEIELVSGGVSINEAVNEFVGRAAGLATCSAACSAVEFK